MRSGDLPALLVSKLSFKRHRFMSQVLFSSNSTHFSEIQLVCDGPTDQRTDERTDEWTDKPSDRDARTHQISAYSALPTFFPHGTRRKKWASLVYHLAVLKFPTGGVFPLTTRHLA